MKAGRPTFTVRILFDPSAFSPPSPFRLAGPSSPHANRASCSFSSSTRATSLPCTQRRMRRKLTCQMPSCCSSVPVPATRDPTETPSRSYWRARAISSGSTGACS